jgi:hypothetical protein
MLFVFSTFAQNKNFFFFFFFSLVSDFISLVSKSCEVEKLPLISYFKGIKSYFQVFYLIGVEFLVFQLFRLLQLFLFLLGKLCGRLVEIILIQFRRVTLHSLLNALREIN